MTHSKDALQQVREALEYARKLLHANYGCEYEYETINNAFILLDTLQAQPTQCGTENRPADMGVIEKTIYRAIMRTWHTGKHKDTNARAVAIVVANDIKQLLKKDVPSE